MKIMRRPLIAVALAALVVGCTGPTTTSAPTPSQTTRPTTTAVPTTGQPTTSNPAATASAPASGVPPASAYTFQEYDVPVGSHPHDVAPAADGSVWYTGQVVGRLGLLDPATGQVIEVPLGQGSAPHGVIVGPDGAAWVTDQGLNAIIRVDGQSHEVRTFAMPDDRPAAPHTPTFDPDGILWFTGASGVIGRLDPAVGTVELIDAPRGEGPYGIDTTPAGDVWYVSLAKNYLGDVDPATMEIEVFEPPTPGQGARRVWSDSVGRLWVSEWNSAQVAMYDPPAAAWREWRLPGDNPMPYSVYVDELDLVWLTDFGSNSLVRFDPLTETFASFALPSAGAEVRQQLGRDGELWGAESGVDKIVVLRWSE